METPALTSPPAFYAGAESQGTVDGSCVLLNCCPHGASRPQMGGGSQHQPRNTGFLCLLHLEWDPWEPG